MYHAWGILLVKRTQFLVIAQSAQPLGCGLDDRGSRVRFPAGVGSFSLHHCVQTGSKSHPASYPMGNGDSFPEDKVAGAWSLPLTSI